MPARLLVRHPDGRIEDRPPQDLSELRDRTCWLDVADPDDRDLDLIEAHLAAASNRLNEVMKVLTSVATILLVMSLVTGFFGMNFDLIPFGSRELFWWAMAALVVSGVVTAMYFRRRGWL